MARKTGVGYYKSMGGYVSTYKGKRYRLVKCPKDDFPDGPNYKQAVKRLQEIIKDWKPPLYSKSSLGEAIERFQTERQGISRESAKMGIGLLQELKAVHQDLPIKFLLPKHVEQWIESQYTWASTTKGMAFDQLRRCLRWNVEVGYIEADPIAKMKKDKKWRCKSRGADYVLPEGLHSLLLSTAEGRFRHLLLGLSRTGARPGELINAVRANYRPNDHTIVHRGDEQRLYKHKNALRKQSGNRDRVIHLDEQTERYVNDYLKEGYVLFPNYRGKPWKYGDMYKWWYRLLNQPLVTKWLQAHNHRKDFVIPYSFRHTWITRALLKGTSIHLVAELCGTSVTMIEETYSHVLSDAKKMHKVYLSCL